MASGIYNRTKYNWMKKLVDMSVDTHKVILLTTSHSFTASNNVLSDINTNEITGGSGTGYTANGVTLTTPTVTQDNSGNAAVYDADDAIWSSATFTAYFAAIYNSTVSNSLVACIDFGGAKSVSSGTFTIQWAAAGILKVT